MASPPGRLLARVRRPAKFATRHGIVDKEAPQADAQEEAQEDAEGHSLAETSRQVGAQFAGQPSAAPRKTRTTTRLWPGCAPGTNHVEPLPARTGRCPVASASWSRQLARRGSTRRAAGSRSLELSESGPPRSSQAW